MGRRNSKKASQSSQPKPEIAKTSGSEALDKPSKPPAHEVINSIEKPRRTWQGCFLAAREQVLMRAVQLAILSPLLMLLSPILYIPCYRASLKDATFTVDRRERVITGSGDSQKSYYLVWTREGEVFCVADSWSFFSFDSSDRYGKLREGTQVQAQVAGWRVPFLSWYRNVVVIKD